MNKHVDSLPQKTQDTGKQASFLSPVDDAQVCTFSRILQAVCHSRYQQDVSYKDLHEKIELDAILLVKYCS